MKSLLPAELSLSKLVFLEEPKVAPDVECGWGMNTFS